MAFTMRSWIKIVVTSRPSSGTTESPVFDETAIVDPVYPWRAASEESGASSLSARLRSHLRDGTIVCVLLQALLLVCVALVAGCSGGGYQNAGTVTFSTQAAKVDPGQSVRIQANVPNGGSLNFSVSGANCSGSSCGTLSSASADAVTYTAPAVLNSPLQATLTAAIARQQ